MSEFFSEQQFYNGISTEYQPDIEDAGQIERFGSGLFEFVYAMLVSAPSAVMAMVSKNVSTLLMNPIPACKVS